MIEIPMLNSDGKIFYLKINKPEQIKFYYEILKEILNKKNTVEHLSLLLNDYNELYNKIRITLTEEELTLDSNQVHQNIAEKINIFIINLDYLHTIYQISFYNDFRSILTSTNDEDLNIHANNFIKNVALFTIVDIIKENYNILYEKIYLPSKIREQKFTLLQFYTMLNMVINTRFKFLNDGSEILEMFYSGECEEFIKNNYEKIGSYYYDEYFYLINHINSKLKKMIIKEKKTESIT